MLDSLRFVQGAVAKKDFVPALTHFRIANGLVYGYNGAIGLCCPIDLQLDVTPKALPFVKAIQTCKDTIALSMTPSGKLSIKSGKFKAQIECTTNEYPQLTPEGEMVELQPGFIDALQRLEPYIAEDASRPWARGILFRGQSAFATNNIVLVEYWVGTQTPVEINIPHAAVNEILRIGEDPTHVQMTDTSATFHFTGNRWLRTQLYDLGWPDLGRHLDKPSNPIELPADFFEQLDTLKPFVDVLGRVYLSNGGITTTATGDEAGASAEVDGLVADACFNHMHLYSLKNLAEKIDLSQYPAACPFIGERLRGCIIGIRK